MGWLRYFFLGDLGQQLDLADQKEEIDALRRQLQSRPSGDRSANQRLESLQRENDELKLYLAAVLRLLITKRVATVDEIRELVNLLDREDGAEDGRYEGEVLPRS